MTPTATSTPFQLPALPWNPGALEPYISARTLSFHYDKHHATYVERLNGLVANIPAYEGRALLEVIRLAAERKDAPVFNNAAQAWNHTFYWQSLRPGGGGEPTGALADRVRKDFGSFAALRQQLADAANSQFGSGWAWLVSDDGVLRVMKTSNAETPVTTTARALLTIDVWEHAYYLDYQNRRVDYVTAVLDHLLNWDFAAANLPK